MHAKSCKCILKTPKVTINFFLTHNVVDFFFLSFFILRGLIVLTYQKIFFQKDVSLLFSFYIFNFAVLVQKQLKIFQSLLNNQFFLKSFLADLEGSNY